MPSYICRSRANFPCKIDDLALGGNNRYDVTHIIEIECINLEQPVCVFEIKLI